MVRNREPSDTELVGGRLCLDFVNTVAWRGRDDPEDRLADFGDLLDWSLRAGASSPREAAASRRLARAAPESAEEVLHRARELREALHRTFSAWGDGARPEAGDLALLNRSGWERGAIEWRRGGFRWRPADAPELDLVLERVRWSAAELLTSGEPSRLRACALPECGWLFYDESRGRRRRWCSMLDCGNRAKARRHYARRKSRRDASDG